jgi:hypothetical protein
MIVDRRPLCSSDRALTMVPFFDDFGGYFCRPFLSPFFGQLPSILMVPLTWFRFWSLDL